MQDLLAQICAANIRRRVGLPLTGLAAVLLGSGCTNNLFCVWANEGKPCAKPPDPYEGRILVVLPGSISVQAGVAVTFTLQERWPGLLALEPLAIDWTSSDTSVATVEGGLVGTAKVGLVHPKKVGAATISARPSGEPKRAFEQLSKRDRTRMLHEVASARIQVMPTAASPP